MLYIVANFKSNKTQEEASQWLEKSKNFPKRKDLEIIVCPPFTLLPLFKEYINKNSLNFSLGAQNVSPFTEGPYTGEENAKQIKEFADYVFLK